MFVDRCRFEKFSGDQEGKIKAACSSAETMAERSLMSGAPISKWFGAADRNVVIKKLRMMHSVFKDANRIVTFVNRTNKKIGVEHRDIYHKHLLPEGQGVDLKDSGIIAYAFPVDRRYKDDGPKKTISHVGSGMRLYLNDAFFGLSPTMQAATVYHEMTHKVLATNDHAYDAADCQYLATFAPDKAVDNADNFALCVADF